MMRTLLESVLEPLAEDVALDGRLALGKLDSSESAEEEVWVVLVGDQVLLVVGEVQLALQSVLVGLGGEVLLEVFNSGEELMLREDAPDLAVLEELEVRVRADENLQRGLLCGLLGLLLLQDLSGSCLLCVVVFAHRI
jgi:hypothetical protein